LFLPFANKYNKIIHEKFTEQEQKERIQKSFGDATIKPVEEIIPVAANNSEEVKNTEVKSKKNQPAYYEAEKY
jgi:hypothetical protein